MSVGHSHSRRPNSKHPAELKALVATPSFQEMWRRPFKVVKTLQIADTAGYSVLGDDYFLDEELVRRVMSGEIRIPGMTPDQVLTTILLHERIEKCLLDADNEIDTYLDAHEFATCGEHQHVIVLRAKPYLYERGLRPVILFNETKPLIRVPPTLACAPLIDHPDGNDRRAIKELKRLGVADAFKVSKESVQYGRSTGADRCDGCDHMLGVDLAPCALVDGLVRADRWCKRYEAKEDSDVQQTPGVQSGGGQDRAGPQNPQPGSGPGLGQPQGQPGGQAQQPPAGPGQGAVT
jgi:hypothetical protein